MNKAFYKQKFVDYLHAEKEQGPLWIVWFVLLPIVPLLAYMCLGYLKILPEAEGIPRHLYIVVGVTSWLLFTDAVTQPFRSIHQNRHYFVRQEISLTHLLTAWLPQRSFAALLQVIFCMTVVVSLVPIQIEAFMLHFIVVGAGFILFLSLGALIAVIGLVAPSVINLVEIANRFLLFLSGVIFPLPAGDYVDVIKLINPYFVFVDNARAALFGLPLQWDLLGYWFGFAILVIFFLRGRLASITSDVRDYLF